MTPVASPPSLLSLPAELRQKIYEELLIIRKPYPRLYHCPSGRDPNFNIDPTILRANRQVYAEAVWILYERNVFQIDLSMRALRSFWKSPYPVIRANSTDLSLSDGSKNEELGLIYPHCLRRMRQIELVTAGRALRSPTGGKSFSLVGDLIVLILSILSDDEGDDWTLQRPSIVSGKEAVDQAEEVAKKDNDKQGTKTLEFRILRLQSRHFYGDEYIQKILELLGEVEKKRKLMGTTRSDVLRLWPAELSIL